MITPIEITPSAQKEYTKVVRLPAGGRKRVVFSLLDPSGKAVILDQEVENVSAPTLSNPMVQAATGANVQVRFTSKVGDLYGPTAFDVVGTILDQEQYPGFVQFDLAAEDVQVAGIYEGTIGRFVHGGTTLVDTWPVLLLVEPSAFQAMAGNGPITIPEIRLALMDTNSPNVAQLLDDVEFSDLEIIYAMRQVVDLWNETPPSLNTAYFTVQDFPYRYNWKQGTVGHLLLMAAARYRRNRLTYSAGGVNIDDQNKAPEYEQIGQQKLAELKDWIKREKYQLNMHSIWGVGI